MTAQAIPRISFYLLATILIAIQAPGASLAQEAASGGGGGTSASGGDSADHGTGKGTSAQSNDSAGHGTSASDGGSTKSDSGSAKTDTVTAKPDRGPQAGGHEVGGAPNGVHAGATGNDNSHTGPAHDAAAPIDAHIAPSIRSNVSRFPSRESRSKFKIVGSNPRSRLATGHPTADHVTRNSIGLAVPSQPGKPDHDNRPAAPSVTPVASPPVVVSTAKPEPTVEHTITTHPNISAPISGPMIGGNANIRRGSNPTMIGGPTKTVAGINGSTITRRTH